jgi:hypothetical protein
LLSCRPFWVPGSRAGGAQETSSGVYEAHSAAQGRFLPTGQAPAPGVRVSRNKQRGRLNIAPKHCFLARSKPFAAPSSTVTPFEFFSCREHTKWRLASSRLIVLPSNGYGALSFLDVRPIALAEKTSHRASSAPILTCEMTDGARKLLEPNLTGPTASATRLGSDRNRTFSTLKRCHRQEGASRWFVASSRNPLLESGSRRLRAILTVG